MSVARRDALRTEAAADKAVVAPLVARPRKWQTQIVFKE
jgi:hypothetical protein